MVDEEIFVRLGLVWGVFLYCFTSFCYGFGSEGRIGLVEFGLERFVF